MSNLFANFMVYASSVLIYLTSLQAKVKSNYETVVGRLNTIDVTLQGLSTGAEARYAEFTTYVAGMPAQLASNLQDAKNYADGLMANVNFNLFGGRTSAQWEQLIDTKAAALLATESARVDAIKDSVWTKVIKLVDYSTNEIPYSSLGAPAVVVGNKTTYRLLVEAPLGATDTSRTITELPGSISQVVVNSGDEIYVNYDAAGTGSFVVYNSDQATVIAAIMQENAALRSEVVEVKAMEAQLADAFVSEAAKINALLATLN